VCCGLQKVFYEIESRAEGRELIYGFVDLVCGSGVWLSGFRNCVTSVDFFFFFYIISVKSFYIVYLLWEHGRDYCQGSEEHSLPLLVKGRCPGMFNGSTPAVFIAQFFSKVTLTLLAMQYPCYLWDLHIQAKNINSWSYFCVGRSMLIHLNSCSLSLPQLSLDSPSFHNTYSAQCNSAAVKGIRVQMS